MYNENIIVNRKFTYVTIVSFRIWYHESSHTMFLIFLSKLSETAHKCQAFCISPTTNDQDAQYARRKDFEDL